MNILQLKSGNPKWRLDNGLSRPLFDDEIEVTEFNFKGVFASLNPLGIRLQDYSGKNN